MHPKTIELLNLLLWSADKLARPTFRNLTDSYETWAYRNGFDRRVAVLKKRQLLERDPGAPDPRTYRLTGKGRLLALGGRDPESRWARPWDEKWRLAVFDVPTTQKSLRKSLRRQLRQMDFGCLQNSVWITPDALEIDCRMLLGVKITVKSLIILESRPGGGETDADIVAAAWNFPEINRRYEQVLKILSRRPQTPLRNETSAMTLLVWAREEHAAWQAAVTSDPLLPQSLLPAGYLGQQAWKRRISVLQQAGQQLQTFQP